MDRGTIELCRAGGFEDGCFQQAVRRGLCWTDYRFWQRHGRARTLEEIVQAHSRLMVRTLTRLEIRRSLALISA